jgi:tight adherence protein B
VSFLVAAVAGVLTFSAALVVMRTQRRALVRDRLGPYLVDPGAAGRARGPGTTRRPVAAVERFLTRVGLRRPVADALDRAGLDLGVGAFACVVGALAVVAFFLFSFSSGVGAGLVGALVAVTVPWLVLVVMARRRARAFEQQLPEILDTLASSLRAGHGFDQALQTVAGEAADPAGREFRRIVAASHLGRSLEEGLAELGRRIRSEDFAFVLDAVTIQRQVGGSLAGLFELVAQTVRSRDEFRRKLRALTGMVRTSASILTLLPILAAGLLTLINPTYMSPLWTTGAGQVMVLVGATMMICGTWLLRKIGAVKG